MIVKRSPFGSDLFHALHEETSPHWNQVTYILADMMDAMNIWRWADAGRKGPKPRPIPRPGDKSEDRHYGTTPVSVEELEEWYANEVAAMSGSSTATGDTDSGVERARGIKAALASGEPRRVVAERFNVSVSTVGRIARGEAWANA
ncbi:hypothetical protein [Dermabacter hominis]|uniref:hypothetical protein n=1 Tax=Dermabacter hominis TaxID=36740 RepID=UPI0021A626AC|nr:hypothetical protein [Dermabacter hominis]MCT1790625.1 hypothetical protein [Dermabacter hominis]